MLFVIPFGTFTSMFIRLTSHSLLPPMSIDWEILLNIGINFP